MSFEDQGWVPILASECAGGVAPPRDAMSKAPSMAQAAVQLAEFQSARSFLHITSAVPLVSSAATASRGKHSNQTTLLVSFL